MRDRLIIKGAYLASRKHHYYQFQDPEDQKGPLLIGLHGYSHNGFDFLRMLRHLMIPGMAILTIDGPNHFYVDPNAKRETGYSFFARGESEEEELLYCESMIKGILEQFKATASNHRATILIGFSQGASLAFYLACRCAFHLDGVVGYSGFLPQSLPESAALKKMPALVIQGDEDEVFSREHNLKIKATLEQKGFRLSHQFVKGSHRIHQSGIRAMETWIRQIGSPSGHPEEGKQE